MCDTVCAVLQSAGCVACSQTVHPHYGGYRDRSPFWRPLPSNRVGKKANRSKMLGLQAIAQFAHVWVGPLGTNGKDDPVLVKELADRIIIKPPNPITYKANTHFVGFQTESDISHDILPDAIDVHRVGGLRQQGKKKNTESTDGPQSSPAGAASHKVNRTKTGSKVPQKMLKMKATYKKAAPGLRALQEARIARMKAKYGLSMSENDEQESSVGASSSSAAVPKKAAAASSEKQPTPKKRALSTSSSARKKVKVDKGEERDDEEDDEAMDSGFHSTPPASAKSTPKKMASPKTKSTSPNKKASPKSSPKKASPSPKSSPKKKAASPSPKKKSTPPSRSRSNTPKAKSKSRSRSRSAPKK